MYNELNTRYLDTKRSLVRSLKADNIEGKQQPPSFIFQWNKLLYQMTDCLYDD